MYPELFFSSQENTFQVVIATDGSCNSHIIFLYENMEWSRTNRIGYSNGNGVGSEYTGHNGDALLLKSIYIYENSEQQGWLYGGSKGYSRHLTKFCEQE